MRVLNVQDSVTERFLFVFPFVRILPPLFQGHLGHFLPRIRVYPSVRKLPRCPFTKCHIRSRTSPDICPLVAKNHTLGKPEKRPVFSGFFRRGRCCHCTQSRLNGNEAMQSSSHWTLVVPTGQIPYLAMILDSTFPYLTYTVQREDFVS